MTDFTSYGITDVGQKRKVNQDAYLINEEMRLFVVADGMGGHRAGDVASRAAIRTVENFFVTANEDNDLTWPFGIDRSLSLGENKLTNAIRLANREICQMAHEDIELAGMGTTIVALHESDGYACIAHAGDSRVYRLRGEEMVQLTLDHSWVSEQLQRNLISEEDARVHRWKNVITRALGNKMDVEVDVKRVRIQPGDIYLLCTDGLTGLVSDGEIKNLLLKNDDDLQMPIGSMVEQANFYGGTDNITIVVVQFNEVDNPSEADTPIPPSEEHSSI